MNEKSLRFPYEEAVMRCVIAAGGRAAEGCYPAFQLAIWGDQTPAQAMKVAIAEAYGRA